MCACDSITAATLEAGKGKRLLRSKASCRRPWYRPQSSRYRLPAVSTSCMDPVTVLAAPQKVSFMFGIQFKYIQPGQLYDADAAAYRAPRAPGVRAEEAGHAGRAQRLPGQHLAWHSRRAGLGARRQGVPVPPTLAVAAL